MSPKISVVMPACNAEKYIAQALESLIRQTFPDWECCIVDDASTDQTLPIIREYAARDVRIRYQMRTENSGSAKIPRDTAIAMAASDWIFSLDADDWIADDTLEKLHTKQIENQADIVLLQLALTDEKGIVNGKKIPTDDFDFTQTMSGFDALRLTIGKWTIAGNGLFHKTLYNCRDAVQNYVNVDEYDFRKMLIAAKTVAFCDTPYFYRFVQNSVTHAFNAKSFETLHVNKLLFELIEKTYHPGDKIIQIMRKQWLHDLINKKIAWMRNSKKLNLGECQKLQLLLKEHNKDAKLIYPSTFQRFFETSRYVCEKCFRRIFPSS